MLWRTNDRCCEIQQGRLTSLGVREVIPEEVELTGQRRSGPRAKAAWGMQGGALRQPVGMACTIED